MKKISRLHWTTGQRQAKIQTVTKGVTSDLRESRPRRAPSAVIIAALNLRKIQLGTPLKTIMLALERKMKLIRLCPEDMMMNTMMNEKVSGWSEVL